MGDNKITEKKQKLGEAVVQDVAQMTKKMGLQGEKVSIASTSNEPTSSTHVSLPIKYEPQRSSDEQLREETSITRFEVAKTRSEMPPTIKKAEENILKYNQLHAENVTIIPSQDTKKLVCRYSLKKPLPKELDPANLKDKPKPEEMLSRAEELLSMQPGILAAREKILQEKKAKISVLDPEELSE